MKARKTIAKYVIALATVLLLLFWLSGCKSVKVSSKKTTGKEETVEQKKELTRDTRQVVEYFDEELTGKVPVRISELKENDSLVFPVESKGVKLDFVVKSDGVSYHARVKPVARSSLTSETSEKETTKTETKEVETEKTKEVQKPAGIRLPWWIWIVIVVAGALALLRAFKVIQNPFKLFLK